MSNFSLISLKSASCSLLVYTEVKIYGCEFFTLILFYIENNNIGETNMVLSSWKYKLTNVN